MKYSDNDLKNVLALCAQGEENETTISLTNRCERALAYRDVSIKFTQKDKQFLLSLFDVDMDKDALETLNRIVGKQLISQQ